uniref:Metalloendopeptidase n=1 Tax=Panagrellus redivivus TaxID=6233 RepID=A0A7E4ZR50_PANRE
MKSLNLDLMVSIQLILAFLLNIALLVESESVHPSLLEYNTKVWAEIQSEEAYFDALTDDDIRDDRIAFNDGGLADDPAYPWPGAVVPYHIEHGKFNDLFMAEFENALNEFHSKTCVRFRPKRKTDRYFVKIIRSDGCWSYVGMQTDLADIGQEVSLGDECWRKGIIIHELNHVLGFFHEHSRFDRDSYITLNEPNIMKNRIHQFDKRPREPVDAIGAYDFYSIMHYELNAFAVDKKLPTIVPKLSNVRLDEMGQRRSLSEGDLKKIRSFYNCSKGSKSKDKGTVNPYKQDTFSKGKIPMSLGKHIVEDIEYTQETTTIPNMAFKSWKNNGYNANVHKFVPFRSIEDFRIRTGLYCNFFWSEMNRIISGLKNPPAWMKLKFLETNDRDFEAAMMDLTAKEAVQNKKNPFDANFKTYPNQNDMEFVQRPVEQRQLHPIKCLSAAEANCMDRMDNCAQLALLGNCGRQPGVMLRMCRRSCCNCDDKKCFDTTDKLKFNTLCAARGTKATVTKYGNPDAIGACEAAATRQNALDFCPKTCGICS